MIALLALGLDAGCRIVCSERRVETAPVGDATDREEIIRRAAGGGAVRVYFERDRKLSYTD